MESSEALFTAIAEGAWGENTGHVLADIGAAFFATGVSTDSYFELVQAYGNAVAGHYVEVQRQLLYQIAAKVLRDYNGLVQRQLSFRVRRFAEKPDFSFFRKNPTSMSPEMRVGEQVARSPKPARPAHKPPAVISAQPAAVTAPVAGSAVQEPSPDNADSGIEKTRHSPQEYLSFVETEFARVKAEYESVRETLQPEIRSDYEKEISDIRHRLDFWLGELVLLEATPDKEYAEDILIGERILLDRVQALAADVYSEPVEEAPLKGLGLRTRTRKPHPPLGKEPEEKLAEGVLPALVNHDVGYGEALTLRPHQVVVDNKIRGLLRRREAHLRELSPGQTIPPELLQGTVVAQTGSGKTRLMASSSTSA